MKKELSFSEKRELVIVRVQIIGFKLFAAALLVFIGFVGGWNGIIVEKSNWIVASLLIGAVGIYWFRRLKKSGATKKFDAYTDY